MKEKWGRIEQFYPDAWTAGVHSPSFPGAPAGLFFIGDKYNGVGMPDRGAAGDLNNIGSARRALRGIRPVRGRCRSAPEAVSSFLAADRLVPERCRDFVAVQSAH